jgi:SnoaL-like polyketide cyclase
MFDPVAFVSDTLNAIWNQKMLGVIYETFVSTVRVHRSCQEDLYGREAIMTDVIERLAALPDLSLALEDVIWAGNEQQGYTVSGRMKLRGHNLGVSRYGAATGQEIQQEILLNAHITNGLFTELWIAEDEYSLVKQLGFDLWTAMQSLEAMDLFIGKPIQQDIFPAVSEIVKTPCPYQQPTLMKHQHCEKSYPLFGMGVRSACASSFTAKIFHVIGHQGKSYQDEWNIRHLL